MRKRTLSLTLFAWLFPLFIFSQTPYLDSLDQVYQTKSGYDKYMAGYVHCFHLMLMDTVKGNQRLTTLEEELQHADINTSDQNYVLGFLDEIRFQRERLKGNYEQCLFYLQEMYEHSNYIEDNRKYRAQGAALLYQGSIYYLQEVYNKSISVLLEAVDMMNLSDKPSSRGNVYYQISSSYRSMEKYDSMLYYINLGLDEIQPNKDSIYLYSFIKIKADAFNLLELPDSTISILPISFIENCQSFSPIIYAGLNLCLAEALIQKKNFQLAQTLVINSEEIVETTDETMLDHQFLHAQYRLHLGKEDFSKAHQAYLDFDEYLDSLYRSKMEANLLNLQVKYDTQNKDFEIQSLEDKNHYQSNMMKLGGSLFAILLGTIFFWFKNREEKIKAIQAKNNQQIKTAFKYNDPQPEIEDDFLKNIIQYIQANLKSDINIDELAKHSGMNRNVMNKKLKSLTNKTAVGLIKEIRLEQAHKLLLKNGKNVSEIAFEVGFKDPNYFSSTFRDKFGCPPSEVLKKSHKT